MGACCSCLGLRGGRSYEDERAPLLSDNYRAPYGSSAANAQRTAEQPDPEYLRREREALDGICHTMSDNVIDVFTIQPQSSGTATPALESKESLRKAFGDLSPEEMQLRTIKKGRGRPVFTTVVRAGEGWSSVQNGLG